jgi:hypothetical protein
VEEGLMWPAWATLLFAAFVLLRSAIAIRWLHKEGPRRVLFATLSLVPLYPGVAFAGDMLHRAATRTLVWGPQFTMLSSLAWAVGGAALAPGFYFLTKYLVPEATWSPELKRLRTLQVGAFFATVVNLIFYAGFFGD